MSDSDSNDTSGATQPEPQPRAEPQAEPEPQPRAEPQAEPEPRAERTRSGKGVRAIGVIVVIAGVILAAAGVVTYVAVQQTLSDEHITVADDADYFAGQDVTGPFTAYAQASAIEKHAEGIADGQTYAELPRDDPRRPAVMDASFLRASLYTSVVAFGLAAMAAGLGVVFVLVGWALLRINRNLA
jgi:hypothetical protein